MYESIDSISAGCVGWTTHTLQYDGPLPDGTPPQWMRESYELNVRDILSVFKEQLASKEFNGRFEYTPYEEYNGEGSRVYSNLMSANWAFREAVSTFIYVMFLHLMYHFRTPYLKMRACVGQCSFLLLLAATRRQYQLQPDIKNIIPYTYHLATSQIQLGVDMGTALFLLPFFLSQRVCDCLPLDV